MKMSKFLELSKVQLGENKYLVISKSSNGEISIAQQLIFKEGKKNISVFIKNAIATDIKGLKDVATAINVAIEKIEEKN